MSAAVAAGLLVLSVFAVALLGWLVPLVSGVRRYRRDGGGRVLLGIGAVWGLLAVSLVAFAVHAYLVWTPVRPAEREAFNPASHTGGVASLAFDYGCPGELEFRCDGPGGTRWWTAAVSNGVAAVPAGRLTLVDLNLVVTGAQGLAQGRLYGRFERGGADLELAAGARVPLSGGFPLTASVAASRGDGGLRLDYKLSDTAGNRFVWFPEGEGRKPPAFEAVAPDGRCFWRDNFEYG